MAVSPATHPAPTIMASSESGNPSLRPRFAVSTASIVRFSCCPKADCACTASRFKRLVGPFTELHLVAHLCPSRILIYSPLHPPQLHSIAIMCDTGRPTQSDETARHAYVLNSIISTPPEGLDQGNLLMCSNRQRFNGMD